MKKFILLTLIVLAVDASAHLRAGIGVNVHIGAPPPCRREVVPARPTKHAVWVPGYWSFDQRLRSYVWVSGSWQHPPHRYAVWVPPMYHHRHYGAQYNAGYWR